MSISFTEQDLAAVDAAIAELDRRFAKLVALDGKGRQRLFKMGNKTEKFCRETLNVLDKNRQMVNPSMDLNKALQALNTLDALRPRAKQIQRLAERMRNTELVLGSEAATAARKGYKDMAEYGARHGLEPMRQQLGARFRKRPPASNEGGGTEGAA